MSGGESEWCGSQDGYIVSWILVVKCSEAYGKIYYKFHETQPLTCRIKT